MTPHAKEILLRFDHLNAALVARGFPTVSPWWRETIRRWYAAGRRRLVARVGRRGGKSSSLCRLAVVEALYGHHKVPPGDVGVVAIVSARRPDALERLRTIGAILDALGVKYQARGDSLEVTGRPIVFTVFTASIAGVSGFTGIFVLCDEVAKWRDSDTGANPAGVVISSVSPTMATQPNARMVLSSSPMGLLDAHADAYALGESAHQCIAHAETWVANPTVSREQTRELEADEVVWQREYAAIPQAEGETSHLTDALVDRVSRKEPLVIPPDDRHTFVPVIDPATRGNAWTLVIGCLSDGNVRRIALAKEWRGTRKAPLVPGEVFQEMAPILASYGVRHVHSDQFAEDLMREIARQHGLSLIVTPWTAGLKADAYDAVKTLAQESKLDLPPDPVVKTDMLGIRVKLTRNGQVYELASQGPRHSDYAPAIAMCVTLCRVPCVPLPTKLTEAQANDAFRTAFLLEREKERKRTERRGPMPVTHTRLRR